MHVVQVNRSAGSRRSRLAVLRDTNDGFVVAHSATWNYAARASCSALRQTGLPDYRVANLVRDADLMPDVQKAATILASGHPAAERAIVVRWLGDAHHYGKV